MSANNLTTTYRLLNSSFRKTMIFHLGIDAGFFTEYTYMLHAMLYCLESIDEGQEIAQDQTDEMETESNLQEYNRRDSRFPDL